MALLYPGPSLADSIYSNGAPVASSFNEYFELVYSSTIAFHQKNEAHLRSQIHTFRAQFEEAQKWKEKDVYWRNRLSLFKKRLHENKRIQSSAKNSTREISIIEYLRKKFPQSNLSPLRWQAIQNAFGTKIFNAFFKEKNSVLSFEKLSQKIKEPTDSWNIIFIKGNSASYQKEKSLIDQVAGSLKILKNKKHNIQVTELFSSSFNDLSKQAHEIRTLIEKHKSKNTILVSAGFGSALTNRMIESFPGLIRKADITSWINIEGKIYGYSWFKQELEKKFIYKRRSLASYQETLTDQHNKMQINLHESQVDLNKEQIPPPFNLSVVNLLFKENNVNNIHEKLIFQGETYSVHRKKLNNTFSVLIPYVQTKNEE